METGEMITFNPLGVNITLFKNTIRDMSKNCYAAYQLLPTSKYYSITGSYPLSVTGSNYSAATTQLQNTAWGKKSDGTVLLKSAGYGTPDYTYTGTTQAVSCYGDNGGVEVLPSHIYTDTELAELNSD